MRVARVPRRIGHHQRTLWIGLATAGLLAALPAARRVAGSVPEGHPPAVPLLEAQGELQLASAALGADSLATVDADLLRTRMRIACQLGREAEALADLDRHPGLLDAAIESLLRAALHARLAQPEACLDALHHGAPPSGLEAYAALLEAEAACALERWDAAHAATERATDPNLPLELRQRLLVVRGLVAQHQNDLAEMRRLAPDLGEAARRDDRTGLLLLQLARSTARAGDRTLAHGWLLDLLDGRPTPAESAYAEILRVPERAAERDPDAALRRTLRLARFEMRSGRQAAARARLQHALQQRRPALDRAEIGMTLAETQLRAGDPAACLQALERTAADARGTHFEPERLRLRARALRRLGQRQATLDCYRELARRFPAHTAADDALYEVGWMLETNHELRAAEQAYTRCDRSYPRGSLADDTDLRAGLCALRDARPVDAAAHFETLVGEHPRSPLLDNALYWQMLAQVNLGDPSGALVLRDRLERDFPRSYFTVLARQRIERGLVSGPADAAAESTAVTVVPLAVDSGMGRAERAHAAYATAITVLHDAGLLPPADFESQTRLWRFLLDSGFATEASWEARRLERRYENEPGALLELIATSQARGAHQRLVRWAYLLGQRVSNDPALRDAAEILMYPAPYSVSLTSIAARHGLSQATVLGLMRQESAFDPRIDSGVGARGLMQLMPEVGRRLGESAGLGTLHPDALYSPEINLELGCALLAEELQRAGGNLPRALAAYNAGSEVAQTWATRLGPHDPPEMLIDLVEYAETRSYLKNVLGNTETYRRLYALP